MDHDTRVKHGSELPEHIIHRIQSLLPPRNAAQTTILSKSWRAAWLTLPTIDLDESNYYSINLKIVDKLSEYARKTFLRYEESNLRIDTFRLCLLSETYTTSGLASEWISKALKLGATDLTFGFYRPHIDIPLNKVFGSNHLKVIKCSGLKSLDLSGMRVSSATFVMIFSSCPLIEKLSLSDVLSHQQQGLGVSVMTMITALHKLTSLVLCRVDHALQRFFLHDLSSKFPILKNLTLHFSPITFFREKEDEKKIQIIASHSLEILNFKVDDDSQQPYPAELCRMPRINFDVPRIHKFTFEGSHMPELSFTSTSRDLWESHVSCTQHDKLGATWLLKLSKFLRDLRSSKIHLCLHVHGRSSFNYQAEEIKCLSMHEVENLTMDTLGLPSLSFNALLDGLFRILSPKIITQYVRPSGEWTTYDDNYCRNTNTRIDNDLFLCRALEQGMKLRSCLIIPSQYMYGLRHLQEINAEVLFDEVWRPLPFDSLLLDDSTRKQTRFRLKLKWKQPN